MTFWRSKVKGQGQTLETFVEVKYLNNGIRDRKYQYKVVVFNIYQKNIQIKSKKPIGLKKRIYWLNGTKEDK